MEHILLTITNIVIFIANNYKYGNSLKFWGCPYDKFNTVWIYINGNYA